MDSRHGTSGVAAFRYASALIDLAEESAVSAKVQEDLAEFLAMLSSSVDLQTLVRSPVVGADQQIPGLSALCEAAKFHSLSRNFLLTLSTNRRLRDVEDIVAAVNKVAEARSGRVRAQVRSAFPLSDKQREALARSLGQAVGADVLLDETVDSSLIGGVVVTLGSVMVDDSVRSKLEALSRAISRQSNENLNKQEEVA